MIEIFHEIDDETRLKVIEGLTVIFKEVETGKANSAQIMKKLTDFTNSFEDETVRAYCLSVIRTVIMEKLRQYE